MTDDDYYRRSRRTDPWTSHRAAQMLQAMRDKQIVYGIHWRFREPLSGLCDAQLGEFFARIFPYRDDPEGAARKRRSELSDAKILLPFGSVRGPRGRPQIIWRLPNVPLLEWQREIIKL